MMTTVQEQDAEYIPWLDNDRPSIVGQGRGFFPVGWAPDGAVMPASPLEFTCTVCWLIKARHLMTEPGVCRDCN